MAILDKEANLSGFGIWLVLYYPRPGKPKLRFRGRPRLKKSRGHMATPKLGAVIGHVSDVIRKPLCARAAQVHVWKNAERLGLVPDPRHPGHAAMQVYENSDVVRHVSWWPGEGVGKGDITKVIKGERSSRLSMDALSELGENTRNNLYTGTFAPRERQYVHGREDDDFSIGERNRWMQLPEVSVEIPGMGASGVWWGLHLPSIASWWDDWSKAAKYVMRSTTNNCAGAVGCALQKGGAECFVPSPLAMTFGLGLGQSSGVSWLCLTPNSIASWAQSLADRLWKLELSTKNLKRDVRRAGSRLSKCQMPGLLPSKDEWLKASHLNRREEC